jgi:hypothetical protein
VKIKTKPGGATEMDNVTLIRIVAGALAVVVLFIIIWRRRRNVEE